MRPHRGLGLLLGAMSAIGPFSIDAYLPSLQDMGRALDAPPMLVQQTLTAYLISFALMTLWQGALSDAFGRRRITLVMLAMFAMASVGCLLAWNLTSLIIFRIGQGVSAGAGMIIGRAIVRDLYDGADARRLMARIAAVFALAPSVAPILGGWLHVWFGWRSVFGFLVLYSAGLWFACWKALRETLPPERRQPMHPGVLLRGYGTVLRSARFLALALALTLNFSALFIYIVSAPAFVMTLLHLGETEFYWLFVPITAGMIAGTSLASRLATRWSHGRVIAVAYGLMLAAVLGNVAWHQSHPPGLPWSVVPLGVYVVGVSFAMPSLTLMALDLFPNRRGLAASCQGFLQTVGNGVVAAVIAPLVWGTANSLATGMLVTFALGAVAYGAYLMGQRRARPDLGPAVSAVAEGAMEGSDYNGESPPPP